VIFSHRSRCAFATGQRAPKVLQTTTLTSQPTLPPDLWPIGYRSPGGVPKWEIIGDHLDSHIPSKFWSSTTERVRYRSTAWNYCAGHGPHFSRRNGAAISGRASPAIAVWEITFFHCSYGRGINTIDTTAVE
jgi:hypothetical protein